MPNVKPYYTTNDLVEAVELTITFPTSQNTFNYSNIVQFLNQELQLNAVPTILEEHQEYFIFKKIVPLVNGISRYEIPSRAIGLTLRDLKFSDDNGNFYDITRVAPDDKAFFQQSNGSNQTVGKFYLEGNEIVLTPQILSGATGSLNFFFALRPNSLVRNDRACIVQHYQKDITLIRNLAIGNSLVINYNLQTTQPQAISLTAGIDFAIGATLSDTATNLYNALIGLNNPEFNFVISGTTITAIYYNIATEFSFSNVSEGFIVDQLDQTITVNSLVVPNSGITITRGNTTYTLVAGVDFAIGINENATATNLNTAITALSIPTLTTTVSNNVITYSSLGNTVTFINTVGIFNIDVNNVYIKFNQLPSTYIDPETDTTELLYQNGSLVDFLQTNPGHRTYAYDVLLTVINNTVGRFPKEQLLIYSSNSSGGQKTYINLKIGDYIALQGECIIPQIPPELHHALAERAASRIQMAIGDREGAQMTLAKIKEMDEKQRTLIGSRVESSQIKVFNRNSLLRLGKSRFRRRY